MKTRIILVAVLAVAAFGPHVSRAMEPQTVPMLATQPGPLPTSMPVILGQVNDATAHSVTVATAKAEVMTFEIDSRTVAPANLKAGDHIRIEFRLMDNGTHFAGRITPLVPGSAEDMHLQNQLAVRVVEEDHIVAASVEPVEPVLTTSEPVATTEPYATDQTTANEPASGSSVSQTTDEVSRASSTEELPRTGSNRNLLLIAGLGAFAAAFGQRLIRR